MLALIISLLLSYNVIATPDEYYQASDAQQQEWCEIISDDLEEM